MSQTSAPKRDIITVTKVVDGELVERQVFAVRNDKRKTNWERGNHSPLRQVKAAHKRLRRLQRNIDLLPAEYIRFEVRL